MVARFALLVMIVVAALIATGATAQDIQEGIPTGVLAILGESGILESLRARERE
jgi:hypothetical protein